MRKNKKTYVLIIIIISLLVLTSRYFAVRHTIQNCDIHHLRQIEPIQEINTSFYLLSFLENTSKNTLLNRYPSYLPVWVVNMTGQWENFGGPALDPSQPELPPERFQTCGSVVNFFTTQPIRTIAK